MRTDSNDRPHTFHGVDVNAMLKIKTERGYGVSIAIAKGGDMETYCAGSGRYRQDFPVNPAMLFQAGSVSKPLFALTLLRYAERGEIDLDADISATVSDFVSSPITFSALLSHTAGFNVHGFDGYRADHTPLTLEDVLAGRGNSPKLKQTMPYGKQRCYSGGGITLAELAFTRITGTTLRDAFSKEVAEPLGLTRTGFFQPLDQDKTDNAAFGGKLGIKEDRAHGYHYYPEHAAAGLWTTPTELAKIGIALGKSCREGGLLQKKTAERMMTPIMDDYGLCLYVWDSGLRGDQVAGHSGWNEGFLTSWTFSRTEDLCVTVMVNRSTVKIDKRLSEAEALLFRNVKNAGDMQGAQ